MIPGDTAAQLVFGQFNFNHFDNAHSTLGAPGGEPSGWECGPGGERSGGGWSWNCEMSYFGAGPFLEKKLMKVGSKVLKHRFKNSPKSRSTAAKIQVVFLRGTMRCVRILCSECVQLVIECGRSCPCFTKQVMDMALWRGNRLNEYAEK